MAKPPPQAAEAAKPDIEAIKAALRTMQTPKEVKAREREVLFRDLFDLIKDLIVRGVSKRAILDKLTELGLVLTYDQFKELLEAEAKRRGEPVPEKEKDQAQSGAQDKVA